MRPNRAVDPVTPTSVLMFPAEAAAANFGLSVLAELLLARIAQQNDPVTA